jgi:hypothetical protein
LLRKLLVLGAPLVVTAGLAALPAASQADVVGFKCPHGVTNHKYCEKIIRCVVPNVIGDNETKATTVLAIHDCRRGHVSRNRRHIRGFKKGAVVAQAPGKYFFTRSVFFTGSGRHRTKHVRLTRHQTVKPQGYGVNLQLNR